MPRLNEWYLDCTRRTRQLAAAEVYEIRKSARNNGLKAFVRTKEEGGVFKVYVKLSILETA